MLTSPLNDIEWSLDGQMPLSRCKPSQTVCKFFQKKLPEGTFFHFITRVFPSTFAIVAFVGNVSLENGWVMQDAGVQLFLEPYPLPNAKLVIGSFLDFPKPKWMFGKLSPIIITPERSLH